MSRAITAPRRARILDAESVIVGYVAAGTRGRAAETRTGSARLLNTNLASQLDFKATIYGHTAAATGGYLLQAAHVPAGGVLASAVGWSTLAILSVSGIDVDEAILSGASIQSTLFDATYKRILTLGTLTGGSGYTGTGTYTGVALTGGAGSGATADIVVAGGAVTSVTIVNPGKGFAVGNELTTANSNLGGAGSGFKVAVGTVASDPEEIRAFAVRATAGNGSNGASAPSAAGTITLCLEPSFG